MTAVAWAPRCSFPTGLSSLLALGVAVLPAGCRSGDVNQPRVVVRDSAGVRIVESAEPAWTPEDAWSVAPEPELDFGPQHDMYQARGAFRLRDGRIVLAHASTLEFWVFSSEGALLDRFGGRGEGPGEFLDISRIRRGQGDSIIVVDFPVRASVLTPDAGFVRTFRIPPLPDGRMSLLEDVFSDGRLLVTPAGGPPAGSGPERRERSLWSISPDGESARHLVTFPEEEQFFFEGPLPRPIAWRRPFFGRTAYYVTGGVRLFWGATDQFEIRVHSREGLEQVFRRAQEARSYGPADVEDLIEWSIPQGSDAEHERSWRRTLRELPTSGTVPAWGWPDFAAAHGPALQFDDEGNLWVVEYFMPGEERNARTVFGPDGSWLGTVELPPGFAPWHIGTDFVLGVRRDDLDVEHVRLHLLNKPGQVSR